MISLDFAEVSHKLEKDDWEGIFEMIKSAAQRIEKGGADCLLICTNTIHKLQDGVRASISIPLISVLDVTAEALLAKGVKKPLLLGTRYTMTDPFFRSAFEKYDLDTKIPSPKAMQRLQRIIFEELCAGVFSEVSKNEIIRIVAEADHDIDGVIFGCTEIGMVVTQSDFDIPVFDTLSLHAQAALDFVLRTDKERKIR